MDDKDIAWAERLMNRSKLYDYLGPIPDLDYNILCGLTKYKLEDWQVTRRYREGNPRLLDTHTQSQKSSPAVG